MKYVIHKFKPADRDDILNVLMHYSRYSMASYAAAEEGNEHFEKLFENPGRYPFYVVRVGDRFAGFGLLRPYSILPTFDETAEITYFILPDFIQKGIGKELLDILESEGKKIGIKHILANISSLNLASLNFHLKFGFNEVGRFRQIGKKFGKNFDVVWMQKSLSSV
ncbi:MAG: GNAT family N-acetyltransferase [Bacteroidetes bacterium]|nr:GNAT family N-acetyltransferase [Bacteroidota bacterium]